MFLKKKVNNKWSPEYIVFLSVLKNYLFSGEQITKCYKKYIFEEGGRISAIFHTRTLMTIDKETQTFLIGKFLRVLSASVVS